MTTQYEGKFKLVKYDNLWSDMTSCYVFIGWLKIRGSLIDRDNETREDLRVLRQGMTLDGYEAIICKP